MSKVSEVVLSKDVEQVVAMATNITSAGCRCVPSHMASCTIACGNADACLGYARYSMRRLLSALPGCMAVTCGMLLWYGNICHGSMP